ncbi:MAG: O-antigen ligase family protein [Gemmatimonadota bacterium]
MTVAGVVRSWAGERGLNEPGRVATGGTLVAGAVAIAAGILVNPLVTAGLVGVLLVFAVGSGERLRLPRLFLKAAVVMLYGYAALGRGFAYMGVKPLYVGEVVLGLGLFAMLIGGGLGRVLRSPLAWLLLAFIGWGALNTIPYVGAYGVDALRDAVLWAYAGFALVLAAGLLRTGWWDGAPALYARGLPWLLAWLPLAFLISEVWADELPKWPGTSVLIPDMKPGDVSVHLAGAAAFLVLGLYAGLRPGVRSRLEWLWWSLWLVGFLLAASQNRGGMLAVMVALAIVFVLRPSGRWMKIVFVAVVLATVAVAVDFEVDIGRRRAVSPRQLASNVLSLIGQESGDRMLSGTREWRQQWWRDIIDYTVHGDYFWRGKGYGVNLADADGYQVEEDDSLRSPHNGHLTILARSGVPGFALWLLLQGTFGVSLLAAWWRARARGDNWWARVDLWILAYWVAFLVNASFDVYLEGPQGGIWFWCLFGFGLAMLEAQRGPRVGRHRPA